MFEKVCQYQLMITNSMAVSLGPSHAEESLPRRLLGHILIGLTVQAAALRMAWQYGIPSGHLWEGFGGGPAQTSHDN